ncbi:PEP-CTERM sorting domain-containing protein [Microseira sp. BLCC-F43]
MANISSVPEPSSVLGLLAFGVLGAGGMLKRQRQQ